MDKTRRRSRLSASIQEELMRHFVAGATARAAAELAGVNRHTATLYFCKLREMIAWRVEAERAVSVAGDAGVFALLVHALSDQAKQFYISRGFIESPLQPMTLLMTIETVRPILAEPD